MLFVVGELMLLNTSLAGHAEKYGFSNPKAAGDYLLGKGNYADKTRGQISGDLESKLRSYGYSDSKITSVMDGVASKAAVFEHQSALESALRDLQESGLNMSRIKYSSSAEG